MAEDLIKQIEKQIVKTDSLFSVDETFEDERFMRVRIAAMHSGINRNNSKFTVDVINAAKDTFANIPILADVQEYEDENGNKYLDYSGHSMHIEDNYFDNDNQKIIYDEEVVGIVPETNNFELVYDEDTKNYYAYVDALLYREYGNYVCEILESRNNKTDVSMEIGCEEISYSAKEKCLEVNKMTACAITLLGEHVTPGMAKAHAEVFSMNEDDRNTQLIRIMQELKTSLDNYTMAFDKNANSTRKEDNTLHEIFEDEEIKKLKDDDTAPVVEDEETVTPEPEPEPTPDEEEPTPIPDDTQDEEEEVTEDSSETFSVKCDFEFGEIKKEFSLSLSDKQNAVYQLVNETYGELDNDWFDVEVYEDDKTVFMHGWFTGKHYKQQYKTKKESYSLVGDRVEVFAKYLTSDEITQLESLKSSYSEVSDKLGKYEAEPEKIQILESEDYGYVADTEEFAELKKQENHFDLTVDEVKAKADGILLEYAKKGSFATKEDKVEVGKKTLPVMPKGATKKSRYGKRFAKED